MTRHLTRRMRVTLLLASCLALVWIQQRVPLAQPSSGQSAQAGYDEKFFSHLTWRNVGPNRGGRSQAAAGSPSRPLEYYFGATGGGVWKTGDGGHTWKPVSDEHFRTSSVGAIAVAESNPDIVYVGMGETELRGNIAQGDGVYKSTDAGNTWTHVGLDKTMAIGRLRVHPENPDLVYVAALGEPYAPTPDRGVYRSKDGGTTWERVLFRDERTGSVDLAMDRTNPDVLYAALWEVQRTPYSLSSGGPGSGLFKSTDGGSTWTEITRNPGLPEGLIGKIGVDVSPADPQRVYAIVENRDGGVFQSGDGGATWTKVNEERKLRQRAFYYTRIYADPKDADTIYVLNTAFFKSTDGGRTYTSIRVPHGDNHDLWISPDDPRRMIEANDGGANVSFNGGESWSDQDYPTAQMYHVTTTAHVPYHVCGAQQDNSTACVRSDGSGGEWYDVGGGESGYIAPDPRNPDVFYAGLYGGSHTRKDVRTGQTRWINPWPENVMGHSSEDLKERFQWTAPIVFSPVDPATLYHGSQHLFRTTNEGQTWTRISPDLTRADPSTLGPSGGPITRDQTGVETYATIFTIAPSYHDANTIWTGSDDGVVHVTRDLGKTWQKVTPPDLPDFTRISLIAASPHEPGTAYLAGNRYQHADRAPYVYRTRDYGESWTKIVTGLPDGDFARAIREDPVRAGLLYLGTEYGVHVSFDAGAHWQSLRLKLPVTPVHDLVVEEHDLVLGTHGRSFYVLDDIGVLRQLTPEVASSGAHLFAPRMTVRSVDEGVVIDYYLREAPPKLTLELLDGSGAVIRTLEGAPEPEKPEGEEAMPPEDEPVPGGYRSPKVPVKAGMNRFVWDMRYEPAEAFPGLILWWGTVRGVLAAPGRYQVRLTAGDHTQTQSFEIVKNPNLTEITDADLQQQFELARAVNRRLDEANETVVWIRSLKEQIAERTAKAGDASVTRAGEDLTGKLTDVEGEIYQWRNQSNQDPLNFPVKLNNKLAVLQMAVENADAQPTDSARAVFEDLSGRLDAQLARLDGLLSADLAALNALLAGRNLPAIDASRR